MSDCSRFFGVRTLRYFTVGSELISFTPSDMREIDELGRGCLDAHDAKERAGFPRKKANTGERTPDMEKLRIQGEWAVADALSVDRPVGEMGVADEGWDVVASSGITIDVKTANEPNGSLCVENYKRTSFPSPDCYVLVVTTDDESVLRIVGGVRFSLLWKHGRDAVKFITAPNTYLDQSELIPWLDLKALLQQQVSV